MVEKINFVFQIFSLCIINRTAIEPIHWFVTLLISLLELISMNQLTNQNLNRALSTHKQPISFINSLNVPLHLTV
jgi:hypothetical protein